jgi:hypothetical protein
MVQENILFQRIKAMEQEHLLRLLDLVIVDFGKSVIPQVQEIIKIHLNLALMEMHNTTKH